MNLRFKEAQVTIRRSPIKDYYAVDVRVRVDGVEKEANELLKDTDFESRFGEILNLLKQEVIRSVNDIEEGI
jgi:hypothetical protein